MNTPLAGRVALVTGGSTGIGRASAVAFARKGAQVVVGARRSREGEETVRIIREAGGEASFAPVDVSKSSQVRNLVETTVSRYGRLDFAFNNAGIEGTPMVPTADYSEETWDQVIGTNLTGVWLCMKYEIPQILKQKGGSIVNMSSVAGLIGGPIGAGYHASKHGVIGLTKTAAIEYAAQGLRVNAVCPAVIVTPMAERIFQDPEIEKRVTALHPLGRVGRPEEVADAVVWLCSEEASFITGHALPIDGGLVAQ